MTDTRSIFDDSDVYVVRVELRHGVRGEIVQETSYKYLAPDNPLHMPEYEGMLGNVLEEKARVAIDKLLEWRRENHQHA